MRDLMLGKRKSIEFWKMIHANYSQAEMETLKNSASEAAVDIEDQIQLRVNRITDNANVLNAADIKPSVALLQLHERLKEAVALHNSACELQAAVLNNRARLLAGSMEQLEETHSFYLDLMVGLSVAMENEMTRFMADHGLEYK